MGHGQQQTQQERKGTREGIRHGTQGFTAAVSSADHCTVALLERQQHEAPWSIEWPENCKFSTCSSTYALSMARPTEREVARSAAELPTQLHPPSFQGYVWLWDEPFLSADRRVSAHTYVSNMATR